MDGALILEWVLKSVFILLALTAGFAYLTLFERRMIARFQTRIGPNRAGPFGLLQPVADGIKLIFKEELIPASADKVIFILAPIITVIPSLIVTAVVPWGSVIRLGGRAIPLYLADINVALLYVMAVTSISVYGITLAGWSSNNKYATLGGLRSTAQMISYEIAMGFCFVVPVLLSGSLSLVDIVEKQRGLWYIFLQPGAAIILAITMYAEVNRAPFDMPEAEQELTAGYHSEYSGMKFALFFMAEYIKMIAVSMIFATLFLGGYLLPFQGWFEKLPVIGPIIPYLGPFVLLAKVIVLLFGFVWVRSTLPRIRYDRLMAFGWKILFPLSLLSVLVTAVVVLLVQ
ncbi:MAG TPA: NADH-quinone oxidoreductase subunit NuoH [Anaerolinea thermolimosa]|uniref:NADH-quinone oxidoreductase subunit H n=1 Tax=Anaerolinea thermolimosa TaxID=229919 RepID=A0A3D1JJ88_9CHLR|nr:NADH-quinone oxidoreductase subunit NuoH [Anaerolinea thermolimosa]GAP07393.1 NADH dehydrogenase subunit H [Anaerolinea thermolimosa]HCE18639.1 NADH-quinone oxidoreductase subunit NuoH [Anaerolinea thermolimosa]